MEKLPIYKLEINDDDTLGMDGVALVEYPAVEVNFLTFNEQKPIQLQFNESQHIITGVALLADTPIYRNNKVYGEHFIVFTSETIGKMVERYSKNNLLNSVNIEHNDNRFVDGVVMVESYFVNRERGIVPTEFSNVPDGSWVVSFKVQNEEVWNLIKEGDVRGFSIQGFFNYGDEISMNEQQKNPSKSFDRFMDELVSEYNGLD